VASVNQTVTATAMPRIVDDLGGFGHYSWVFTAYILASIVTIPLFGKLSDIYGRRPLFVAAIALFATGSIVAGAAPSMNVLVAGRVIQGLGAGGLGPLGLAVMGDVIAPRARGKWQAVNGTVYAASAVGGPLLGGWLTDHASWRLAFLVSLVPAAAALVTVWLGFGRFGERHQRTIDYAGAALLTVGAGGALYAVSTGGVDRPWGSPAIVVPLVASLLALVAFVVWERRARDPILPLDLLRGRTIGGADLGLFAIGASMISAVTFVPLFVQNVLGRSATSAGTVLIPLTLSWFAASIVAGQIVSRTGRSRPVLLAGPPLAGAGFALLATMGSDVSLLAAARNVAIVGAGFGLMVQTFVVVVQNAAPRAHLGAATASAEFSRWVGALVGVAAMGAIVAARVGSPNAHDAPPGLLAGALHTVFAIGVGIAALAFVAALLVPDTRLRGRFEPASAGAR
jgi:EmrB/QacA subfamily drug resistance transporter